MLYAVISKVHFGRSFLLEILASMLFISKEKVLTLVFGISSDYMSKAYFAKLLKCNLDSEGIRMFQKKRNYLFILLSYPVMLKKRSQSKTLFCLPYPWFLKVFGIEIDLYSWA